MTAELKILIVEDNPTDLKLFELLIKRVKKEEKLRDLDIDVALNGSEAVEKFEPCKYRCIFMDQNMPVMTGAQATKEIRKVEEESGSHTPIIAYSSCEVVDLKRECRGVGFDAFFTKHLKPAGMNKVLEKYVIN